MSCFGNIERIQIFWNHYNFPVISSCLCTLISLFIYFIFFSCRVAWRVHCQVQDLSSYVAGCDVWSVPCCFNDVLQFIKPNKEFFMSITTLLYSIGFFSCLQKIYCYTSLNHMVKEELILNHHHPSCYTIIKSYDRYCLCSEFSKFTWHARGIISSLNLTIDIFQK